MNTGPNSLIKKQTNKMISLTQRTFKELGISRQFNDKEI